MPTKEKEPTVVVEEQPKATMLELEPPKGMPKGVEAYYAGIVTEDHARALGLPVFQSFRDEDTGQDHEFRVPVVNKTVGPVTFQQYKERVWQESMKTEREKHPGGLVWLMPEQVKLVKKEVAKRVVRYKGALRGVFMKGKDSLYGDIPLGCYCYLISVEEAGAAFENPRGRPQTLEVYETEDTDSE